MWLWDPENTYENKNKMGNEFTDFRQLVIYIYKL